MMVPVAPLSVVDRGVREYADNKNMEEAVNLKRDQYAGDKKGNLL